MSHVEKVLLPDERVLCITTISGIVYLEGFTITIFGGLFGYFAPVIVTLLVGNEAGQALARILGGVAFVIAMVGTALLIFAYARQASTELAVTNRRVIAKYGIISRMTYEIMVDRITGANFEQSFFGRLLGYGTVIVHGAGGDISPFERISNPEGFHKALMQVLERGQTMVKK
jgi:uncharacterized membrane protein YdbT with pleckstrin-like domain